MLNLLKQTAMITQISCFSFSLIFCSIFSATSKQPNVVLVITDDQDFSLGGMRPMSKTRNLIFKEGASFNNFFTTTPICCASRTSLLTGKYAHNLDDQMEGWCGDFTRVYQEKTFVRELQRAGYATGLFGKFVNDLQNYCADNAHVPLGWTRWFHTCNFNTFYNNTFCDDGKMVSFDDNPEDYMTSLIGNKTLEFVQQQKNDYPSQPLFLYISPHAPHVPATPAPWYENKFSNVKAPRTPNWNATGSGKHWLVQSQPPLSKSLADASDELFRNRWRSLLSVDDIVEAIYHSLEHFGEIENTYFLYTSDHGYNLGQFRLPSGKYHVYDHDIRIPFAISGPKIKPGTNIKSVGLNIDIAATILDLADVKQSVQAKWGSRSDGISLASLVTGPKQEKEKIASRDRFIVEYWGISPDLWNWRGPCNNFVTACPGGEQRLLDCPSNTYTGLRIINETHDILYAEFSNRKTDPYFAQPNFTELYNLLDDPYQMKNIHLNVPLPLVSELRNELTTLNKCSIDECRN